MIAAYMSQSRINLRQGMGAGFGGRGRCHERGPEQYGRKGHRRTGDFENAIGHVILPSTGVPTGVLGTKSQCGRDRCALGHARSSGGARQPAHVGCKTRLTLERARILKKLRENQPRILGGFVGAVADRARGLDQEWVYSGLRSPRDAEGV